jgi:multiple sugar transport system permease protein
MITAPQGEQKAAYRLAWTQYQPFSDDAEPLRQHVFAAQYNDLFWPLITTSSLEMRTLPVGLTILNFSYGGMERPLVLSGAVFATVPILIIYVIFQRRIIKGITLTGMGGR